MCDQIQTCLFPNEIISEILIRLPAKSICRFKTVSKSWNSLICNPNFISSYISHNPPSSPTWVIVNRAFQFNFDSKDKVTHFNLAEIPKISTISINPNCLIDELSPFPKLPVSVLCSSNGLLLCRALIKRGLIDERIKNPKFISYSTGDETLVVVNPITGKWVHLLNARNYINNVNFIGFVTKVDFNNGVVEKFVVVEYKPEGYIVCFCSDTGKWVCHKLLMVANELNSVSSWRGSVFQHSVDGVFELDGHLFWFDLSCGIIAWEDDPFRRVEEGGMAVCRFIPLPRGCLKPLKTLNLEEERGIFGSGGCIHYMEMFRRCDCLLKVWRLKDYESCKEEWCLVYSVCHADVDRSLACWLLDSWLKYCFIHPYEVDTVFFKTNSHIFSYNFRTKIVETCDKNAGRKYVFPFVIPVWPISLPPRLYAVYAKHEGNMYLKDQNFVEAIERYSKSIALSPSAVTYANRALSYLKLNRFCEVEVDCTEALNLKSDYVKVYICRAMARKEVGNLKGSMEDLEFASKLDPNDQESAQQLAEIKSLLWI